MGLVELAVPRTRTSGSASAQVLGRYKRRSGEVLVDRVRSRRDDASDATEEVVRRQARYDLGAVPWPRLNASGDVTERAAAASRILGAAED
jgi:predicted kinase